MLGHTLHTQHLILLRVRNLVVLQLSYSPHLAPSDSHLFPESKRILKGIRFRINDKVKATVKYFIKNRLAESFAVRTKRLVTR